MILYLYSIYFLADKGKKFVFIILIAYSVNVPQKKLQRPIKVYIKTHKLVISLIEWKLIKTQIFVIFSQPSQVMADKSPQVRMSLNDVRFNSNWVFSSIMIIWKFILKICQIWHNELCPFIDEVKLASPPFWRSTLFVSIPFGITKANAKKKYVKVCTEKKYTHIFGPSLDPNSWISKMITFCVLAPKLTRPRRCVVICVIVVGVIQNYFLCQISNLLLKVAHWLRGNILSCSCSTTYGL